MIRFIKIGLLIPLVIFFSKAYGQDELMPRLAIGATAEYHVSFMEFGGKVRWDYFQGMSGGLQFQFMSRKMLGFETGLLYGEWGWYEFNNVGQYGGKKTLRMIELPLYSHLSLGKKKLRILLDAGPYFRFVAKDENVGVVLADKPMENSAVQNTTSYGLSFQGGLAWRTPSLIIQARGNFHMGLTNFYEPVRNVLELSAERSSGGSISVLIPFGNKYIDE